MQYNYLKLQIPSMKLVCHPIYLRVVVVIRDLILQNHLILLPNRIGHWIKCLFRYRGLPGNSSIFQ